VRQILQRLGLGFCSLLLLGLLGCTTQLRPTSDQSVDLNLTWQHLVQSNPSDANPQNPDNFLIERPQYTLAYNRSRGTANWASWQLNSSWLGAGNRPAFTPDDNLPSIWVRITPEDYIGSGFDRGHLVPAADRNRSPQDSAAVFVMSNIFPQAPDNNRGPWEKLERYCRDLAKAGDQLYIIAGPAGTGGRGSRGNRQRIGRGKITVPAQAWKVIVVNEQSNLEQGIVTANTRIIAVIIPNQQGIKENAWQEFRVSVREVEQLTGYNFFATLPIALQNQLETQVDHR
jgi:endonuclease G, mitochondrial